MQNLKRLSLTLPLILILAGCPTIAPYSQKSYEYATSIKAEAIALISKSAEENYEDNKIKVEALKLEVETAFEYANGIPNNERIAQMWAIQKDEGKRGSLFNVLALWKNKKKFDPTFVVGDPASGTKGIKEQISKEFDEIIGLESGKNK